MTLADEVIERHVKDDDTDTLAGYPYCELCRVEWPCDAYRLAVIVQKVEAAADNGHPTTFGVASDRILAITKGDGT